MFYAYNKILNVKVLDYFKKTFFYFMLLIFLIVLDSKLIALLNIYSEYNFINWILSSSILASIDIIILLIIFIIFVPSFKNTLIRFKNIIKKEK